MGCSASSTSSAAEPASTPICGDQEEGAFDKLFEDIRHTSARQMTSIGEVFFKNRQASEAAKDPDALTKEIESHLMAKQDELSHELTQRNQSVLAESFDIFDTNRNGSLDIDETRVLLSRFTAAFMHWMPLIACDSLRAEHTWRLAYLKEQTDGLSEIQRNAAIVSYKTLLAHAEADVKARISTAGETLKVNDAWERMDKNKDGRIDRQEFLSSFVPSVEPLLREVTERRELDDYGTLMLMIYFSGSVPEHRLEESTQSRRKLSRRVSTSLARRFSIPDDN